MQLANVHLFITLVVLLQAPANGNFIIEIFRKIKTIIQGDFTWPCEKWLQKYGPKGPTYLGCQLCAWGRCSPAIRSVTEVKFDEVADAELLAKALTRARGLVNKDVLTDILIHRSETQRTVIATAYKARTGVELTEKIQSRLMDASRYQKLMIYLATPLPVFYAEQFAHAMLMQNNREKNHQGRTLMVEMLTSLPKCLIKKIIVAYNRKFGQNSDFDIDLKKSLENAKMPVEYIEVMEKLVKEERDNNMHASWLKALSDSYSMKKVIESQAVNEMSNVFADIFTKRSFPQIIETIKVYEAIKKGKKGFKSLGDDIQICLGRPKEIYKVMVRILKNKPLYFVSVIEKIFKNSKTFTVSGDIKLIFLIRGRIDIDLKDIIRYYNKESKRGFRKDFDSWDNTPLVESFHDAVVKITK